VQTVEIAMQKSALLAKSVRGCLQNLDRRGLARSAARSNDSKGKGFFKGFFEPRTIQVTPNNKLLESIRPHSDRQVCGLKVRFRF
jgi:hypothetical protein